MLPEPDEAVFRLARAIARQAAREDHARELAARQARHDQGRDLRTVFERAAKRPLD